VTTFTNSAQHQSVIKVTYRKFATCGDYISTNYCFQQLVRPTRTIKQYRSFVSSSPFSDSIPAEYYSRKTSLLLPVDITGSRC